MFKSVVVCNGILHCSSFAAEDIDLMLSNQPNPHSGGPLLKNSKCRPLCGFTTNSAPYIINA